MGEIKSRSEIRDEYKWSICDLFASDEKWEESYRTYSEKLNELSSFDPLSVENLADCLKLRDELAKNIEQIYVYANLRSNEDSTNTKYQAYTDRTDALAAKFDGACAFIEPGILALDEKALKEALKSDRLKIYEHHINDILRSREHILDSAAEKMMADFYEVCAAPDAIFGMLNEADLTFEPAKDSEGKEHELTHGTFIGLLQSDDRELRKNAFKSLYSSYYRLKNTIAAVYSASVKKDVITARLRRYPTALDAALSAYNIPKNVYTELIETVRKHLPLMHRYVSLRKKLLGVDKLYMYDLYTPIVKNIKDHIEYDEAKEQVLQAVKPMGEEYVKTLESALNAEKWVDIYENKGKRSGAYSWGAYGCHPFVSLNFNYNLDSMFTLAHEMGHAMHSNYTWAEQPVVYGDYTIFVAEVASTVNEALLMEHLLATTEDCERKKYLLNHFMEQFRGTLFRQTMFAEFELKTHEMVEQGIPLTFDTLCEVYMQLNRDYYGDDIELNEEIAWEWARIPHFYNDFYVYQYATGYSAAIALSQRILKENGAEDYIGFLKGGCSKYSIDLLKGAGVDMSTPRPVENAMKVFEGILCEMEKLV
ncbi:MAG: oligoendopeptidase F [Firmicutes bacterium]|nr:oligoendopeptidase F [Bacillota bacterium]